MSEYSFLQQRVVAWECGQIAGNPGGILALAKGRDFDMMSS